MAGSRDRQQYISCAIIACTGGTKSSEDTHRTLMELTISWFTNFFWICKSLLRWSFYVKNEMISCIVKANSSYSTQGITPIMSDRSTPTLFLTQLLAGTSPLFYHYEGYSMYIVSYTTLTRHLVAFIEGIGQGRTYLPNYRPGGYGRPEVQIQVPILRWVRWLACAHIFQIKTQSHDHLSSRWQRGQHFSIYLHLPQILLWL
jgi:hypothetical protein